MTDECEKPNHHQIRGMKSLTNAGGHFEPLAKRAALGQVVADQLVALGYAAWGPCSPKDWTPTWQVGIQLTDEGFRVLDRVERGWPPE